MVMTFKDKSYPLKINETIEEVYYEEKKPIKCDRKEKLIDEHKRKVNSVKGYTYIRSYFAHDILDDGKTKVRPQRTHIRVKHEFCKQEYDVELRVFLNKHNKDKSYKCPLCCGCIENSIYYQNKEIADMIKYDENKNEVNTKLIYYTTHSKFYFKCNKCGELSDKCKRLDLVVNFGYSCHICSDGVSTPEKFVANILTQLKIKFERQKVFEWSKAVDEKIINSLSLDINDKLKNKLKGNKRYDFYIEHENQKIIIEVHGIQHYSESTLTDKSLKEEQGNDKLKEKLAKQSDKINKYIIIDCRYSDYYYMKNNIIKELEKIVNSDKLDVVNYKDAYIKSQKSLKVAAWNLYNEGKKSSYIAKELNMSISRIRAYLTDGTKIKKCNYSPKIDRNSNRIKLNFVYKDKVMKEFNSLNDLYRFLRIKKETYDKYIGINEDIIDIHLIEDGKGNQYTKKLISKLGAYDGYKIVRLNNIN